ncbi:hypothetical protein ACFQX4_17665 [Roseomonas sp. GCM10028921]
MAGLLALPALALAHSSWGTARPISLVVPFAAGGATDSMVRLLARLLGAQLGPPVVENAIGAGGNIGAEHVPRSAGDGRTALFAVNSRLFRRTDFNRSWALATVGLVCTNARMLLAFTKSGITDLAELLRRGKGGDPRNATPGAGFTMLHPALHFLHATRRHGDLIPIAGERRY